MNGQIDTKNVKNDNLATILMDLIGLIGQRVILPTEHIVELMDRIVKIGNKETLQLKPGMMIVYTPGRSLSIDEANISTTILKKEARLALGLTDDDELPVGIIIVEHGKVKMLDKEKV